MLRPAEMLSSIPGLPPGRCPPTADVARVASLRSPLVQLRVATSFWPDAVRLHPAARAAAGERYGALAA